MMEERERREVNPNDLLDVLHETEAQEGPTNPSSPVVTT